MNDKALQYVIDTAVRAVVSSMRQTCLSAGGIPRKRTNRDITDDLQEKQILVDILFNGFGWGHSPSDTEHMLYEEAVKQGKLVKERVGYRLPHPEPEVKVKPKRAKAK